MAQALNQFNMTQEAGSVDLLHANVLSCIVDAAESTSLVAGQPVKLATTSGGVPKVLALTANTDPVFGYVVRNIKDASRQASEAIEIARWGSVIYLTAGAAITRGALVESVYSTSKVISSAGINPIVGRAIDTATADGDLIRVELIDQYATPSNALRVATVTATLAEINAGKTLIAATAGKSILVTDLTARVTGGFATSTSVDVQSSNASPVKVSVALVAALTNGAVVKPGDSNVSRAAGYGVALGSGDALVVANVGTAATGGTSIAYTITYTLV